MNGLGADGTILPDSWAYDPINNKWSKLDLRQPAAGPPPLYRQFAVVRDKTLVVYGGLATAGPVGALWLYSFVTQQWTLLDKDSASGPGAR
jgi:hypothetical protein